MIEKKSQEITEDEAALYDRQIRLWGLDAQKRLRGCNVLVSGLGGLGAEVCKNLVLAGVKSLTLQDHRSVDTYNSVANFFIPPNSIDANRAEASRERCQKLNPMVNVKVDTQEISEKDDEWFSSFDVVVLTDCPILQLYRINTACREHDVQFYAGDVWGFLGFLFADLMEHDYAAEVKVSTITSDDADCEEAGEPPSKKTKSTDQETKMVKRDAYFSTLRDAMEVDWGGEIYGKRMKRTNPTYFIVRILQQFEREKGRRPSIESSEEDKKELLRLRDQLLKDLNVPVSKVDDSFSGFIYGALSPVCAVVGGILSQEVIKAVSHKDPPINNFFFYNAQTGAGMVECIGD